MKKVVKLTHEWLKLVKGKMNNEWKEQMTSKIE